MATATTKGSADSGCSAPTSCPSCPLIPSSLSLFAPTCISRRGPFWVPQILSGLVLLKPPAWVPGCALKSRFLAASVTQFVVWSVFVFPKDPPGGYAPPSVGGGRHPISQPLACYASHGPPFPGEALSLGTWRLGCEGTGRGRRRWEEKKREQRSSWRWK